MEYEARKLRDKQYDEEKRNVKEEPNGVISKVDERIKKVNNIIQTNKLGVLTLRNASKG